jgi:hypothetical protein
MRHFPENLKAYSELGIADYQSGLAQKTKKDFLLQVEALKFSAAEVNKEVQKYIIINKLGDFRKGSTMPEKWGQAHLILTYSQKIEEAVFTVGSLERHFYELLGKDSLDKAEKIRLEILQLSASLGGAVKVKPPANTDASLREAAINSINLYRMDAFRNFKSMIATRKKELAFEKKYSGSGHGKNDSHK